MELTTDKRTRCHEAASLSPATDPGLYRSGAVASLFSVANVHQPEVAVDNVVGSRLSHALQHHRFKWMYYHN